MMGGRVAFTAACGQVSMATHRKPDPFRRRYAGEAACGEGGGTALCLAGWGNETQDAGIRYTKRLREKRQRPRVLSCNLNFVDVCAEVEPLRQASQHDRSEGGERERNTSGGGSLQA